MPSCPLLTGEIPPIPLIALEQFLLSIIVGANPITRKRKHILFGFVLHPIGRTQHTSDVSTKLMLIMPEALRLARCFSMALAEMPIFAARAAALNVPSSASKATIFSLLFEVFSLLFFCKHDVFSLLFGRQGRGRECTISWKYMCVWTKNNWILFCSSLGLTSSSSFSLAERVQASLLLLAHASVALYFV